MLIVNRVKPDLLFENDRFVVLNKPAGMLSVPDREGKEISLKNILKQAYGNILTVHRLDKDTSGVIVYAKNEAAHKYLSGLFEGREVEKYYIGLVHGVPVHPAGTVDAAIMEHPVKKGMMVVNKKGKKAITDYQVLETFGSYSLLRFRIHTGRTHQIRVHMKNLGHPILCDEVYGDGKPVLLSSFKRKFNLARDAEEEKPLLNRLALHAERLVFMDADGTAYEIEAPPLKDMKALLQQLRKWKN